ncbi:hypothetical protein BTO22_11945 [Aliivibrio sifiae]|uniref:Heptosyltransferase n=2 Tax=Aliivibrio sifiae TaxID=566293 RepID=A0A2S7X2A8_9GAMM|nr:hypothetical protein BTO22_11945 [Aliivibrio sifiae]
MDTYDIDLRAYTKRRPHNSFPYRPSYIHMIEMAEEQMNHKLPINQPQIFLNEEEDLWAKKEIEKFPYPLIWIQSTSTSSNRLWPDNYWKELKHTFLGIYSFIDLSIAGYSLRESLAIAKHSFSGICLDSFMVHGAAAVNAKNTLVLLGSSRPECVTYPGQYIFYKESICDLQPCGMHGYFNGCEQKHEHLFHKQNCIHLSPTCMSSISVGDVIKVINSLPNNNLSNTTKNQYDYTC